MSHRNTHGWVLAVLATTIVALSAGCGRSISTPAPSDPKSLTTGSGGDTWDDTPAPAPAASGTPGAPLPPAYHNTDFCKVDSTGAITSADGVSTSTDPDGTVNGRGGGCVQRPILETWAVVLNHQWMKAERVSDLVATQLGNPPAGVNLMFNLHNIYRWAFITVEWDVQWWHSVTHGTLEAPNQVVVTFQKVNGTSHITHLVGSIVLDRTSDAITSFVSEEHVLADQEDEDAVNGEVKYSLERVRTGAPDWHYF